MAMWTLTQISGPETQVFEVHNKSPPQMQELLALLFHISVLWPWRKGGSTFSYRLVLAGVQATPFTAGLHPMM